MHNDFSAPYVYLHAIALLCAILITFFLQIPPILPIPPVFPLSLRPSTLPFVRASPRPPSPSLSNSPQVPRVRRACLVSLSPLYSSEDCLSSLTMFTQRFAPRIVQMAASDCDPAVACAALHLTTLLYR